MLDVRHQTILAGYTLLSACVAVFFGGAGYLLQTSFTLALLLWSLTTLALTPRLHNPQQLQLARHLGWVLLPVGALGLAQLLPLPEVGHPLYRLVPQSWASLSLNRGATLFQLVYLTALAAGAYVNWQLAQNLRVAQLMLRVLAVICIMLGVYGLAVYALGNGSTLWLPKYAYPEALTSTFINRNHYATFAGLGALMCLALFLERVGEVSSRLSVREKTNALLLLVLLPRWPWLAGAVLLLINVVLSTSRAGLVATMFGLSSLLFLLALSRKPVRWWLAGFWLAAMLAGLALLEIIGTGLGSRLSGLEADNHTRSLIFSTAWQAIGQAPLTGHGLGAFEGAYAMFSQNYGNTISWVTLDHAHNTYLELAVETGLPATALLLAAAAMVAYALARGLRQRRIGVVWPALGLSAMVLTGVHALVDFSLSIPAVAWLTSSIIAMALAQSNSSEQKTKTTANSVKSNWIIFAPLVMATAYAALACWAAWLALPAQRALRQLEEGKASLSHLTQSAPALAQASHLMSWNATYPHQLAQLHLALADATPTSLQARKALLETSLAEQQHSLNLAPANGLGWYRLAWTQYTLGQTQLAEQSLANSLLTNSSNLHLVLARLPLVAALYPSAGLDNQKLFAAHLQNLWQARPGEVLARLWPNLAWRNTLRQILAASPGNAEIWQKLTHTPLGGAGQAR